MSKRFPARRGMTLLEVAVVTTMGVALAAAGGSTLAETARRSRATDAAANTLLPHTIARDRAVAARTCVEPVLVPSLTSTVAIPANLPLQIQNGRGATPRVAVIEWSACGVAATATRIDFYELDGQVEFTRYSGDGRLVFSPDGSITADRPASAGTGVTFRCGSTKGRVPGAPVGPPPVCRPPPPPSQPPADVTFAATTYFGAARTYRVYARIGATEAL